MISRIIYFIVRLLNSTYRYHYRGIENLVEATSLSKNKNYILGTWHKNVLHGIMAQRTRTHICIVSRSKDANPVDYTLKRLGHITVRGSSKNKAGVNKGGQEAKIQMIEFLKEGIPGAVTVDGPKGPALVVKPGIIDMALKSETVVIPYAAIPQKRWTFNSWDKFRLPMPFSKILVSYGKPIPVSGGNFEHHQKALEEELNRLESEFETEIENWHSFTKDNTF